MKLHRRLQRNLTSLLGAVICGWSAALLCFFFPAQHWKVVLPVAFLSIILLVAMSCGVLAGVLGSVFSALIFACFLYQPLGSVAIANKAARENLGWMLLGGLVISYLLGSKASGEHRPN